jgi:hypothetical protein
MHGLSSTVVGLWSGFLAATGAIAGGVLAGWIADRLSAKDSRWNLWVATAGSLCVVPATLLFVSVNSSKLIWPVFFVASFFNATYGPPTYAITQKLMPIRMRSLGPAILLLSYNLLGIMSCNILIGFFSDFLAITSPKHALAIAMALTQVATLAGAVCTIYAIFRIPRDFVDSRSPAHP